MSESIRLSVSESAKMFGVSPRTIRRAITSKEISYIVVQGRYKIDFESLLKWSQSSTTVRNKRDNAGIGQFVDKWRIKNTLYSPNRKKISKKRNDTSSTQKEIEKDINDDGLFFGEIDTQTK